MLFFYRGGASSCLEEGISVFIDQEESSLSKDSKALAEQVRTISKLRLGTRVGRLSQEIMGKIDFALKIHLDLE